MLSSRLSALVFVLPLSLPLLFAGGCDDGGPEDDGMSEKEKEELVSHEGEDCEGMAGMTQVCGVDGVEGQEFCAEDPVDYTMRWSSCFTDPCDEIKATRACSVDGKSGEQWCFEMPSQDLFWGACQAPASCTLGDTKDCGFGDEMPINMTCYLNDFGEPEWSWEDCNTPLVLSFEGREPAFAAAPARARAFDITGAGVCLDPDWPTAATPWLALDRDHNGSIDGGSELFGNGTRIAAGGRAEQGFQALGELDSDDDGRITPADAAWSELVLWADHDGDRRSTGFELLPLDAYGVEAIDLDYRSEVVCDGRGNCGSERAAFTFRDGGQSRRGEVIDVYLACGE